MAALRALSPVLTLFRFSFLSGHYRNGDRILTSCRPINRFVLTSHQISSFCFAYPLTRVVAARSEAGWAAAVQSEPSPWPLWFFILSCPSDNCLVHRRCSSWLFSIKWLVPDFETAIFSRQGSPDKISRSHSGYWTTRWTAEPISQPVWPSHLVWSIRDHREVTQISKYMDRHIWYNKRSAYSFIRAFKDKYSIYSLITKDMMHLRQG